MQMITMPHIVCRSQSPQVTTADRISGLRRPSSCIHLSNSCDTHIKLSNIYCTKTRIYSLTDHS